MNKSLISSEKNTAKCKNFERNTCRSEAYFPLGEIFRKSTFSIELCSEHAPCCDSFSLKLHFASAKSKIIFNSW